MDSICICIPNGFAAVTHYLYAVFFLLAVVHTAPYATALHLFPFTPQLAAFLTPRPHYTHTPLCLDTRCSVPFGPPSHCSCWSGLDILTHSKFTFPGWTAHAPLYPPDIWPLWAAHTRPAGYTPDCAVPPNLPIPPTRAVVCPVTAVRRTPRLTIPHGQFAPHPIAAAVSDHQVVTGLLGRPRFV